MNKFIALILISILVLSACTANEQNKLKYFFEKETVDFSCEGVKYTYSPTSRSFLQQDGLFKGMKVRITDTGSNAEYGDYVLETDLYSFSALYSFDILWRAFSGSETETVVSNEGAFVIIVDSSRFLVYYNEDSEIVRKLVAETVYGVFEYTLTESEEER